MIDNAVVALTLLCSSCSSAGQVKSVMTDAKLIYRISPAKTKGKSAGEFYVTVSNKSDILATDFVFKSVTAGYRYGIHKDGDPFPPMVLSIKLDWSPAGEHDIKPWTTIRFIIRPPSVSTWMPPKKNYIRFVDLFAVYRTKNTLHDSTWMLTAPE